MEIRYDGLEGTGEFWFLNPNVVKLNITFKQNQIGKHMCSMNCTGVAFVLLANRATDL